MTIRTTKRSREIDRMSIGNSYLRREFQDFTAAEQQDDCPRKRLGITFFRYMVKKTIDNFILSGAHDVGAQADCLNTIVQLAFNILLARDKKEAKTAREILSTGQVSHARAWDSNSHGGRLGSGRHCALGQTLVLGHAAAELAARFDLTAEMTVAQLHDLRARPDVLEQILSAFESAVPLNLDYHLKLSVRDQDRTFRLVTTKKPAEPLSGSGRLPLLGITTALGAD